MRAQATAAAAWRKPAAPLAAVVGDGPRSGLSGRTVVRAGSSRRWRLIASLLCTIGTAVCSGWAAAGPCEIDDFETRVSAGGECLAMSRFGTLAPASMVVWIHGNATAGGPAQAHIRAAQRFAAMHASEDVLSVALLRPGYSDDKGNTSTGSTQGRADNWTRPTVESIGMAIERLRTRFRPRMVVLVGHSGGAAIVAVLAGLKPGISDAVVLAACPCDLVAWRAGRAGPAWISEDPMRWVARIDAAIKVRAMTGSRDDTTPAPLARDFVAKLQARGIDARFQEAPGVGHIELMSSPLLLDAVHAVIQEGKR